MRRQLFQPQVCKAGSSVFFLWDWGIVSHGVCLRLENLWRNPGKNVDVKQFLQLKTRDITYQLYKSVWHKVLTGFSPCFLVSKMRTTHRPAWNRQGTVESPASPLPLRLCPLWSEINPHSWVNTMCHSRHHKLLKSTFHSDTCFATNISKTNL